MPTEQAWAPVLIAAGLLPSTGVATPTGQAQGVYGALFRHSGVGFWEIDFAGTYPTLDTSRVICQVSIGPGTGPGVAGFQYGMALSGGPLYAISSFRSDTNAQADCELDVMFWLMPSRR